jgi:hypothetical protein
VEGIDFHLKRYLKDGHIYKEIDFEDKGKNFISLKSKALTLDFEANGRSWNLSLDIFGDYKLKKVLQE